MLHARHLQLAAAATPALPLAACSGGGGAKSPTAPAGPQATLATAYGTVTVFTQGNDFDPNRATAAIEAGYARARAQVGSRIDSVSLDGMSVQVAPGTFGGEYNAVGQYFTDSDTVEMAKGVENVLTHELQHRFCHKLGYSGDCCTYQDH